MGNKTHIYTHTHKWKEGVKEKTRNQVRLWLFDSRARVRKQIVLLTNNEEVVKPIYISHFKCDYVCIAHKKETHHRKRRRHTTRIEKKNNKHIKTEMRKSETKKCRHYFNVKPNHWIHNER